MTVLLSRPILNNARRAKRCATVCSLQAIDENEAPCVLSQINPGPVEVGRLTLEPLWDCQL
jgi:hypothetical protein